MLTSLTLLRLICITTQAMEVNTRQSLYSPSATAHRRASLGEYPDK